MKVRIVIALALSMSFSAACREKGHDGTPPAPAEEVSEWELAIGGDANGDDRAHAVAVDATGIYIAGRVTTAAGGADIYVAKLSLTSGLVDWERTIDGSAHGFDTAYDIALGGESVYAAGSITNGAVSSFWVGHFDAVDGTILWQKVETSSYGDSSARAIVADATYAYAAGSVAGGLFFAKFAADGLSTWGWGTVGEVAWSLVLAGPDLYVGGVTHDALTDSDDVWLGRMGAASAWGRQLGTGGEESVFGLALGSGKLYAHAGTFLGTHWVAAVDAATGAPAWQAALPGTMAGVADFVNRPRRAIAWLSGTVYVAAGTGGVADVVFTALDGTTGVVDWQTTVAGAGGGDDQAVAMVADAQAGALFATGHQSVGVPGGIDAWVIRMGLDGVLGWQQTFDGTAHGVDRGNAIAINASSVVVAGEMAMNGAGSDVWVRRLAK